METKWRMEWLPSGRCNINPNDGHGRIATVWIRDSKINNLEEVETNARLIASSPELLEACKQCADPMGLPVSLTPEETLIQIRRLLRQIIAKAEGK